MHEGHILALYADVLSCSGRSRRRAPFFCGLSRFKKQTLKWEAVRRTSRVLQFTKCFTGEMQLQDNTFHKSSNALLQIKAEKALGRAATDTLIEGMCAGKFVTAVELDHRDAVATAVLDHRSEQSSGDTVAARGY